MKPAGRWWLVAGLLAATPATARAQLTRLIGVGAGASAMNVERPGVQGRIRLSGVAPRFGARIGGRLGVELTYVEGSLSADSGSAADQDLVDGSALLAFRALPWLTLKAGPHLTGFVTPGGTERWLRWEARGRLENEMIPGRMRAHVELWTALATDVNVAAGGTGRGAEAGLSLQPGRSPVALRLGYAVDALLIDGGGTTALQSVSFSLRFGGSQ